MERKNVTFLTQSAMIAAIYVVLTVVFAPFSFGEVQVRVSEMLTILPIFYTGSDTGTVRRLPDRKCIRRRGASGYHFRQPCDIDRSGMYLEVKRSEALDRSAPTGSGEYLHRTVRTALCIRRTASDPAHDADRRNRRGNFL